jgi:hypothetical protein
MHSFANAPAARRPLQYPRILISVVLLALIAVPFVARSQNQTAVPAPSYAANTRLDEFIRIVRTKAKALEGSSGMQQGFRAFTAEYKLQPNSVRYSDYVLIRMIFEASRDAGFWNLHWDITDQPPNSDRIWTQWKAIRTPSAQIPTATAECDELSALFSFLVERSGVKGVGLFWPYPNHTVAVWVVQPSTGETVRVVVPTSQIFLEEEDMFGTRKFNPWTQKRIYEYTRRDVADSFEIPKQLFDFYLLQVDKYAGASDATLQQLRYLREGVFRQSWSAAYAAGRALSKRNALGSGPAEDLAAYWNFAQDMRPESPH